MPLRADPIRLVCRILLKTCSAFVLVCSVGFGNTRTPGRICKHYRNIRWGFCLDYPASWKARFGTDGSGILLVTRRSGEVRIGGLPDQPQDLDDPSVSIDRLNHAPPTTLEQNFTWSLSALREYGHASDIEVLKKDAIKFHDYPALDTTIRFHERSDPALVTRIERTIFINKDDVIFTADLKVRQDRFRQLESVFTDIIFHRLKLDCASGR